MTAKNLEDSALAVSKSLGIELVEIPRWNCCGVVYSLASDDLMRHLGAIRNMVRAQTLGSELGVNKLVTLCAMCYSTMKIVSKNLSGDREKMRKIDFFMDEEPAYKGGVEVVHLLQTLRDDVGFKAIAKAVQKPLKNLRVASYYGCMLLRPEGVELDDPENPSVMEDLVSALGGQPVDFPYKTECCGSYHTVAAKRVVGERATKIAASGTNLSLIHI